MTKSTTRYSEAMGAEICERITEGKTLSAICAGDDMPSSRTVLRWLRDHGEFSELYDRARQSRADTWAEEIVSIADDTSEDYVDKQRPDGSTARVLDAEHVQRSRLRIDTRKWVMARAAPKKYGEHLSVDSTSEVTVREDFDGSALSKRDRDALALLVAKARAGAEKAGRR